MCFRPGAQLVATILNPGPEPAPSPSHHQFELNHHSILFVDWDTLSARN